MPMKSPVACTSKGCSRLAKAGDGGLCELHKRKRHQDYQKSRNDSKYSAVYDKKAWKLARGQALQRDGGWCAICKEVPAVLVDHINELKDGGLAYSIDNLQSLCQSCHTKKTLDVANKR